MSARSGIENFLSKIVLHYASSYLIEVEIDSLEQLRPALRANVDAVLLDNFSPEEIKEAVSINKQKAVLEASECINENTLQEFARSKNLTSSHLAIRFIVVDGWILEWIGASLK